MAFKNPTRRGRNRLSQFSYVAPTETSGGPFSDDRVVDLIRDPSTGQLKLLVWIGARCETVESLTVKDQEFVPPALDLATQRAIALPTHVSDHGSTESLFNATHGMFTRYGMSKEVADAAVYFVFCTWFPERCSPAPSLLVTGPCPEASLLLQLLSCLVRRGLQMAEIDSNGFCALAELLRPTLLIDSRHMSPRSLRLISCCGPRVYVPWKESVVDFALAKAIYLGVEPNAEFSIDFSLQLNLSPSRASVCMLDENVREQIIAYFQPKFLNYRLRNFVAVRDSTFDLPELDSEGRVIARMLGACIVDCEKIQGGIRHLLSHRDHELRAKRWTDLTCVVVEILLAECHVAAPGKQPSNGPSRKELRVNVIAKGAEAVLRGRAAPAEVEPRAIGAILGRLGLHRKRNARGYRILLTLEARRTIHRLAREHQVESVRDGAGRCDLCKEIFEDKGK